MKGDKNTHKRERKSESRRSSILKRQDTCTLSEGTEGSSDGPRTPRRVSFATTATIREFACIPWHLNASDESGNSSQSDVASTPSESSPSVDTDNDDVFGPDPVKVPPHASQEGTQSPNTSLTEEYLAASPEDQPRVLVEAINTFIRDVERDQGDASVKQYEVSMSSQSRTILYTNMNKSACGMELTSNISQLSHSFLQQDVNDAEEFSKACGVDSQQRVSSCVPDKTILFTDMDESACGMDMTANISQLNQSLLQEQTETCHLEDMSRNGETLIKSRLNRRPSFSDEQVFETGDDKVFPGMTANVRQHDMPERTVFFGTSDEGKMDVTQNLTVSSSKGYSEGSAHLVDSVTLKPRPKQLDDLFKLVKKRVPPPATTCHTNDGLTQADLEDMEMTGELSQTMSRTALSDIIINKALTPIEEMSVVSNNASVADQENLLPGKTLFPAQPQSALPHLNKVCSRLEQIYSMPNSLKQNLPLEKENVSPSNKENYPLLSVIHKSHSASKTVLDIVEEQTKTVHFGNSSHHSKYDVNESNGDMELTECQTRTIHLVHAQEINDDPEIEFNIKSHSGHGMESCTRQCPPENSPAPLKHSLNGQLPSKQGGKFHGSHTGYSSQGIRPGHSSSESSNILQENGGDTQATIYFKNSDDMEFTTSNTRTIDFGPSSPQSRQGMKFQSSEVEYPSEDIKSTQSSTDSTNNLQEEIRSREATIYFKNSDDMEFTMSNTRTINLGPSSPQSKQGENFPSIETYCPSQDTRSMQPNTENGNNDMGGSRNREATIYFKNSDDMEFTTSNTRTIHIGPGSPVFEKSSIQHASLLDHADETHKGMGTYAARNGDAQVPVHKIQVAKYAEDKTQLFNNSQMEMTECHTKTIQMGNEANGEHYLSKTTNAEELSVRSSQNAQFSEGKTQCFDNNEMEMTEFESKAFFAGNKENEVAGNFPMTSAGVTQTDYLKTRSAGMVECLNKSTLLHKITNGGVHSQSCDEEKLKALNNKVKDTMDIKTQRPYHEGSVEEKRVATQDLNSDRLESTAAGTSFLADRGKDITIGDQQQGSDIEVSGGSSSVKRSSPSTSENKGDIKKRSNDEEVGGSLKSGTASDLLAQDVDKKREALRKSLSRDIGLPLTFSKRSSSSFDPFQRRKSCNFDLLLGKGNRDKGLMVKEQAPLNAIQAHLSKTIAITASAAEIDTKLLPWQQKSEEETDISGMITSTQGIPTFLAEHCSSSSSSQNSDRTPFGMQQWANHSLGHTSKSVEDPPPPHADPDSGKASLEDTLCSEVFEPSETLNNQEMPDLAENLPGSFLMKEFFTNEEEASVLSDLDFLQHLDMPPQKLKMPTTLQGLYEMLGISRVQEVSAINIPAQNVLTTTTKDKLYAKVASVPQVNCLEQHVEELEAALCRAKQECKDRLTQFSRKPPVAYDIALQELETGKDATWLKTKAQEMMNACKASARAKWKRHKADYLMKYSSAREEACSALDSDVEHVISETEKVIDHTAYIDKCLQEVEMIMGSKGGLTNLETELTGTESEVLTLRHQCDEMDERKVSLERSNKEAAQRCEAMVEAQEEVEDRLAWMESLMEWTILKNTKEEIHFGFLFGTLIMQVQTVNCGSSSRKISKVSLHSRLGTKSKPWAKLAHDLAVTGIDCDQLQRTYEDHHQLSQLLAEVSSVVCSSRQLSSELRLIHLKHQLFIDNRQLTFVVSNRKTRQKIKMVTTLSPSSYPQVPCEWSVTTLLGTISSHDVKSTVEQVPGGNGYLARVLCEVENHLSRCGR